YAARGGTEIIAWFEERKTAAKTGRPEFMRMVNLLRGGAAEGVIIHKIDRSTRNYRDWADIDELIEGGVDVRPVTIVARTAVYLVNDDSLCGSAPKEVDHSHELRSAGFSCRLSFLEPRDNLGAPARRV